MHITRYRERKFTIKLNCARSLKRITRSIITRRNKIVAVVVVPKQQFFASFFKKFLWSCIGVRRYAIKIVKLSYNTIILFRVYDQSRSFSEKNIASRLDKFPIIFTLRAYTCILGIQVFVLRRNLCGYGFFIGNFERIALR